MKRISINNLIGIEISENYPWKDTLFISSGIASDSIEDYEKCEATITIEKVNKVEASDCRDIGGGLYIKRNALVDVKYGVRVERINKNSIRLTVSQECNEWLVICIQLLLLELGSTLIHGAALEKDGEVILLPSWGGVGKTATVLKMVKDGGWRLLGDDLVVLKNNEVLPFLKPFVIYPYHKSLFPNVFSENKGRIVTNQSLSKIMSKAIPVAKNVLRIFPGLLAFVRKHNPQSLRVDPKDIFDTDSLSSGGHLKKVVWLERIVSNDVQYYYQGKEVIVSKTVSVSIMELFSERLQSVLALCGSDIFNYEDIFIRMHEIVNSAYNQCKCYELDIPTTIKIDEIGDIVIDSIAVELDSY